MLGTSGKASDRTAVVTANGRTLPALMYSIDVVRALNVICTWPPHVNHLDTSH
jgi:hypothetical protein